MALRHNPLKQNTLVQTICKTRIKTTYAKIISRHWRVSRKKTRLATGSRYPYPPQTPTFFYQICINSKRRFIACNPWGIHCFILKYILEFYQTSPAISFFKISLTFPIYYFANYRARWNSSSYFPRILLIRASSVYFINVTCNKPSKMTTTAISSLLISLLLNAIKFS